MFVTSSIRAYVYDIEYGYQKKKPIVLQIVLAENILNAPRVRPRGIVIPTCGMASFFGGDENRRINYVNNFALELAFRSTNSVTVQCFPSVPSP